jgi:hypothetical protein
VFVVKFVLASRENIEIQERQLRAIIVGIAERPWMSCRRLSRAGLEFLDERTGSTTHWTSGVDSSLDERGHMDASVVAFAQTCSEAMVNRPAKARLFFLNMGCPSIEIERDHLVIQSMKQFDRAAAGRPQI